MSVQHKIETMEQLAAVVTEDNVATLTADLTLWLNLQLVLKQADGFVTMRPVFVWNDDNDPGVSAVRVTADDGTVLAEVGREQLVDDTEER